MVMTFLAFMFVALSGFVLIFGNPSVATYYLGLAILLFQLHH